MVVGCGCRAHVRGGYCRRHSRELGVQAARRVAQIPPQLRPCAAAGCPKPGTHAGYCPKHFSRVRKYGDPSVVTKRPAGSGTIMPTGYKQIRCPGHPNANKGGQMREHRLVMSQQLGRPLLPGENVHHINGDRLDNRPENLELWVKSQPSGQRAVDLLRWAYEVVARYSPRRILHLLEEDDHLW